MVINPGNFDKRIKIIKYEIKKDADGFEEKIENVVSITWAQVKTRFLMRTPKIKLDKDMFIKFAGNDYNIVYINDYGYDKKYTEIIAELVRK